MRTQAFVAACAMLGLAALMPTLVSSARADGRAMRSDILPVSALKPGMKGYGLTVFEGIKPERFDVEIIDVLEGFRPRQELILIKTAHPRLDVAKIVAGMSGSPVYVNGKMIGAYSYGWTFGVEPVAGVTPIRAMLDDLERPLPRTVHGIPMAVLPSQTEGQSRQASAGRFRGEPGAYDVAEHAQQLQGARPALRSELTQVATPLMLGGMTSGAVEEARRLLSPFGIEPMQAGGTGSRKPPPGEGGGYIDGGAIGVSLVRGDMSAMGLGTVTRVEQERLVAFGHPMMNIGITSLPTTEARVLWFMASQMRSFKMGEGTRPRGALINDRMASIVVDRDGNAPTVDVSLKVQGEPGAPFEDWDFVVAHDRFLTPAFLGVAIGSGLEAAAAERRDVTYTITSKVKFSGYPEVSFEDFGATPTGTPETSQIMQSDAIKAIGAAFNNPWEPVRLESIDVVVDLKFARELATLRGAELLTPVVGPGEKARIRITLEPYAGPRFTKVVTVPIPKELAGEKVKLKILPGYAVDRKRAEPEALGELLANMQEPTLAPRSLVVSYETGQGGAAFNGVVAEDLPPGALDVLNSEHATIMPAQFTSERHHVVSMPVFVLGSDHVEVQVREALR